MDDLLVQILTVLIGGGAIGAATRIILQRRKVKPEADQLIVSAATAAAQTAQAASNVLSSVMDEMREEMRRQDEIHEAEREQWRGERARLDARLQRYVEDVEALRQEVGNVNALRNEIAGLRRQVETVTAERNALEAQNADLRARIGTLEHEVGRLKNGESSPGL